MLHQASLQPAAIRLLWTASQSSAHLAALAQAPGLLHRLLSLMASPDPRPNPAFQQLPALLASMANHPATLQVSHLIVTLRAIHCGMMSHPHLAQPGVDRLV